MTFIFLFCLLSYGFIQEAFSKTELQKDYGAMGKTFEILEEDLIEVIENKLKRMAEEGNLEAYQKQITQKVVANIKRPKAIEGIHHTTKTRSFTYDPSVIIPYDLKDHKGQIFHGKGTRVNPLDYKSLTKPLLFIDGDDQEHINWAMTQDSQALVILVNGLPFELTEKLNRSVYFDQEGTLTKRFGVSQVPARVTQKKKYLLVEEINLHKKGS